MIRNFFQDIKHSLSYVFEYPNWYLRLWPFPVIAFVPIIGLVSIILLKGWRFTMTQHLAKDSDELPKIELLKFFKIVVLLWFFTFLYLLVPAIFLFITGLGGPIALLTGSGVFFEQGVTPWANNTFWDLMITVIVYVIWMVLSLPAYQAGMVRYARSNSWRAMLNVPANVLLVIRKPNYFIKFYLSWIILSALVLLAGAILSSTILGIIFVPMVTSCIYYVTTAHELGSLARKIEISKAN